MERLVIPKNLFEEMIAHVAALAPLETCGLLAGKDGRAEKLFRVANQARSETRFVMEPLEQLRALEWIDENGMELLAIYHSHPRGPQTPSPTDVAEARYRAAYVILSRVASSWRARAFWIEDGLFREIELQTA